LVVLLFFVDADGFEECMFCEDFVLEIGLGFGIEVNMDCCPANFRVYD